MTNNQKELLIKTLELKGVKSVCPMCGNHHFILADGYFSNTLQGDTKNLSLGGAGIPTIPIVCSNCGFVSQHALGVLGLLPKEENEDKQNDNK
jgi:hypothetical protein